MLKRKNYRQGIMKIIYKSTYDYFGYIIILIVLLLLSLIPCIGENGHYIVSRIPLSMFCSIAIGFLIFKRDIKKVTFLENSVIVYFPLIHITEEYNYSDIEKIVYSKYRSKSGRNLIIYTNTNNRPKKIIFGYYNKDKTLFDFLIEKGFDVEVMK